MKTKLHQILFLSAFIFGLSACESEPDLAFRSDLLGRWRISNFTTNGTETLRNDDGTERERNVSTSVTNNDLEITFSDNPARYYSGGTYTVNYDYVEDGETSSFSTSHTGIGQGSWTFDNGRLELLSDNGAEVFQFERVTKNDDGSLDTNGMYELRRIRTDQAKTAVLEANFRLLPL